MSSKANIQEKEINQEHDKIFRTILDKTAGEQGLNLELLNAEKEKLK